MDGPLALRDLPAHERPRERMLAVGAEQLSVAELLAILLRTGHRDESVLVLAQRLLQRFGSLRELAGARVEELTAVKGVGVAKAVQVKAGLELGRRLARLAAEERLVVRGPGDVASILMDELRFLPNEHFVCLFLNTKNHIIGKQTVFVGTLNATVVHPREIFREAIRRSSAAVILAHNHPSGDPQPSPEDIVLTRRLVEAGELLGIPVLDHIVIGDNRFVSLKEKGYL